MYLFGITVCSKWIVTVIGQLKPTFGVSRSIFKMSAFSNHLGQMMPNHTLTLVSHTCTSTYQLLTYIYILILATFLVYLSAFLLSHLLLQRIQKVISK